jgi:hypothetical protein
MVSRADPDVVEQSQSDASCGLRRRATGVQRRHFFPPRQRIDYTLVLVDGITRTRSAASTRRI